jgi:type I restriction enzyme S subunit
LPQLGRQLLLFKQLLTKWDYVRSFAISQMTGSSGRQRVPIEALQHIEVPLPPLAEQRAIAHILGSLDDKIDLNRRMNRTLEEIARALFRSWFVDFDPVHAHARGEAMPGLDPALDALFPAAFEDSPLGPIPAGWRVGTLGELVEVTIGGDWGKEEPLDDYVPTACLRGVDLENLRESGWANAPTRWVKKASLEKRKMETRDILIAASGQGPLGRPLWISPDILRLYPSVVYSNFCKRLRAKSDDEAVYVDRVLHNLREGGGIWDYASGTSIPNLDVDGLLRSYLVVIPAPELMTAFHDFYMPIGHMLYSSESRTLAALRDTLLPKLMSGELRVAAAAEIAEAAA